MCREGQEPCSELQIFKSLLSHLLWFLGQVSADEDNNETYLSIIAIIFTIINWGESFWFPRAAITEHQKLGGLKQ